MADDDFYQTVFEKFVFKVRKDYYYSENDFWVKFEDGTARVGVTDFLQLTSGDVVFVETPRVGIGVKQFQEIGEFESIKTTIPIVAPISGMIKEVNENLKEMPELINNDPYVDGWIFAIIVKNVKDDLKHLLDAEEYFKLMKDKIDAAQGRRGG